MRRFYSVTLESAGEIIRLGATSAIEASKIVEAMSRSGWYVGPIKRGADIVTLENLQQDAAQEGSCGKSET